jgi:DNA invertase Pin-like site-specific DNA recombinase
MTQIVKFPDKPWAELASIADKRDMRIADVIAEAAHHLLGSKPVGREHESEPVRARDVLDVLQQVQELYELHRSQKEIAAVTGLTPAGVAEILNRLHLLPEKKPKPHAIDLDAFRRLYAEGFSDRQIATDLHVSSVTVGRERRALGLPVITPHNSSSKNNPKENEA